MSLGLGPTWCGPVLTGQTHFNLPLRRSSIHDDISSVVNVGPLYALASCSGFAGLPCPFFLSLPLAAGGLGGTRYQAGWGGEASRAQRGWQPSTRPGRERHIHVSGGKGKRGNRQRKIDREESERER